MCRISISMNGRGKVFDNIFVERLWRSVKYEKVYLSNYRDIPSVCEGLRAYFGFYNKEWFYRGLENKTGWDVYSERCPNIRRYQTITEVLSAQRRTFMSVKILGMVPPKPILSQISGNITVIH